jgi:hypothetical protein
VRVPNGACVCVQDLDLSAKLVVRRARGRLAREKRCIWVGKHLKNHMSPSDADRLRLGLKMFFGASSIGNKILSEAPASAAKSIPASCAHHRSSTLPKSHGNPMAFAWQAY